MIVGAGVAGRLLVRDLRARVTPTTPEPVAFVDDDPSKVGTLVEGLPVLGATARLADFVRRYRIDEVLVAIPSATGRDLQRITAICRDAGVHCRAAPAVSELQECRLSARQVREVRIEDLLGREQVQLDAGRIEANLRGHCMLVTGAGGSIGSELARQAARAQVGRLVLFERAESDLFDIESELRHRYPSMDVAAVIGDILDEEQLLAVFETERPSRVCHAAAYKHVPLLERHTVAAVRHNVLGTANVVRAARSSATEQFVLISSDKAVRPTSFMGATKRAAERVALSRGARPTRVCAVRFGNVLGSRGSVVPLFNRQIAAGGPVTVTDRDAVRYFMTVGEAVQLVLQASAVSRGGEVFHLDMGQPVRIVDLAEQLIRLSDQEPGRDVEVVFTGLRPGEKLVEELHTEHDEVQDTAHPRIKVVRSADSSALRQGWLEDLADAAGRRDTAAVMTLVREAVPEYTPSRAALE